MLENLAGWIAARIKNVVPEHPASYEVLKFAVAIVFNVVLVVPAVSLIIVWKKGSGSHRNISAESRL